MLTYSHSQVDLGENFQHSIAKTRAIDIKTNLI